MEGRKLPAAPLKERCNHMQQEVLLLLFRDALKLVAAEDPASIRLKGIVCTTGLLKQLQRLRDDPVAWRFHPDWAKPGHLGVLRSETIISCTCQTGMPCTGNTCAWGYRNLSCLYNGSERLDLEHRGNLNRSHQQMELASATKLSSILTCAHGVLQPFHIL